MSQEAFGEHLQNLRIQRRLTRNRLAQIAQVSTRAITYWENGQYTPREHEMQAVLNALEATNSEKTQLILSLATLRGDNVVRQDNALLQSVAKMPLPGAGDLLAAMRVRRSLSRREAAVLFGISESTLSRWENNRIEIPESVLPLVQTGLNISSEETNGLRNRLAFPPDETGFSLEQCKQFADTFIARRYLPGAAAIEMEALALQRKLWILAAVHPEVRPVLSRVTQSYAEWLLWHDRKSEFGSQAQYALDLADVKTQRDFSLSAALNIVSWSKIYGVQQKPEKGVRFLYAWLPRLTNPVNQIFVLADTSLYAAQADDREVAKRSFQHACQIYQKQGNESEAMLHYLRTTHARILLLEGKPLEAYTAVAQIIPDLSEIPANITLNRSLVVTEILLAAGEHRLAEKWLRLLTTQSKGLTAAYFRRKVETLTRRL